MSNDTESYAKSHLASIKIYVFLLLSIKLKSLISAIKANKNQVALSHIFLLSLVLYAEVQDMSQGLERFSP